MNKTDYLDKLEKELKNKKIKGIDEIVNEYEQHFNFKIADGYNEDEIIKSLGAPENVAKQFNSFEIKEKTKIFNGKTISKRTGLIFLDVILSLVYILMCATVIVVGSFAIATMGLGFCLITTVNIAGLIPSMPYIAALLMGLASLALSVLAGIGTVYMFLYVKQWLQKYCRWHSNVFYSTARAPIPFEPNVSKGFKRITRKILIISSIAFGGLFAVALFTMFAMVGFGEFWHEWNWFQ